MTRPLLAVAVLALIAGACSSSASTFPDDAVAIRVNSDISTGRERLLLAISQLDATRLGSPEKGVTIRVAPEEDLTLVQASVATFDWTILEGFGFYRATFDFDRPGIWQVTVVPEEGDPLDTILISVGDDSCRQLEVPTCAPRVGEPAPSLATQALADATLADLTTDPDPDERLYRLSLDEALSNRRPTVIVFATPAYCTSAACGPVLANLKPVIDQRPGVDFLHIEIYDGLRDPDFAPGPDTVAAAVREWDLPSEPWVFVTDAEGIILARFEGTMTEAELLQHL